MTGEHVGTRIKRLREARRLTQNQLQERAHVSHGYISQVEKGGRNPKRPTLLKIAEALGVPVEQLEKPVEKSEDMTPEERETEEAIEFLNWSTRGLTPAEIRLLAQIGMDIRRKEMENYEAWLRAKPPKTDTDRKPEEDDSGIPPTLPPD